MKPDKKFSPKAAAAIAAVFGYIRSQEEAAAMTPPQTADAIAAPAPPLRLWGISGRQETMGLRTLMQLRTFQRARLR